MKKGLLLLSFIICAFLGFAQQRPAGFPSPNSTGYGKIGYQQADSGFIQQPRDTFPAKYPTLIRWSGDNTFWQTMGGTGARWFPLASGSLRAIYAGYGLTKVNDSTLGVDTGLIATRVRVQKAVDSLGVVKQPYNANTTILGNTTTGSGGTIVLSGSPSLTLPSFTGVQVSGGIASMPTGSGTLAYTSALTPYKLISDTLFDGGYTTRNTTKKIADSLAALISGGGFGTVQSVSTTDGVGIVSSVASPTANPNISIRVDTNSIATRLRVQKGIDSLGVLITTGDAAKLNISDTAAMLTPNYRRTITKITNSDLVNSTISGTALGSNLPSLTFGTYLQSGALSYNGTTATTITTNGTSSNLGTTLVARDANGDFSARNISASLVGNASSASTVNITNDNTTNATMYPLWSAASSGTNSPKVSSSKITFNPNTGVLTSNFAGALTGNASSASVLQTPRTINGVAFDGSADISISASVDSSLSAGYGITGSPFDGSLGRTWVVDTTKIVPYTDTLASYGIASKTYVNTKQGKFMVNVADFGAIPNDGTNDATAIRNAINYAYNNGFSTVFFPAGVYTSTEDSIGIRSGIKYLGYGATIQQVTSNTCIFLSVVAVNNVVFEGLTLLGKGTDYNGTDSYTPFRPTGILISSSDTSKNIKILNCTIRNFAYSGITIAYGRDVWIENNKLVGYSGVAANDIKNFGVDINNGNRRVTVIGNHIDSVAQGILVQGNVWEYSLIGNIITNVIGQHGIYVSSGWNSVISGNSIKNCVANGILVQLTSGQLRGIENMSISNNVIDSAGGYGIYVYRISGTGLLKNISINNNVIELSYTEGGSINDNQTIGYAYSLLLQSDKYVNVNNHVGYNSNESGIYINGDTSRQLNFNNVRIYNPSLGGSNAYGISANGGSYLFFNNAYVSDSTATMAYSFYLQPNVDQATVRVTNSTFLNAPVRFESSKAIGEYNSNIAASYYNSSSSITTSRISVNGNYPDKENAITLSVGSGTVTSVATNIGSGITGGTITTSGTIAADTTILSTKANVTALLLGKGIGSVTSIATDATMQGGTITSSGTLKVDTVVIATRLRVQKGIDSLGSIIGTKGSGTVTSVATNTGSGITGGIITSTGTIAADTSILSTKANVTALLLGKLGLTGGSTITTVGTLSSGAVPYSLLTGTVPTWNQNTTGSAATSAAATGNNFSISGSFPYLFLRNTNTATEDYYIQGSINSTQSGYGNYLGFFLPTGKELFVDKYITSSVGYKILNGNFSVTSTGLGTFASRLNVGGAADNSLFSLNNGGGTTYTNGFSPNASNYTGAITLGGGTTYVYTGSGAVTWTLPTPSGNNQIYIIKNNGSGVITLNAYAANQLINLSSVASSSIIISIGETVTIQQDGSNKSYIVNIGGSSGTYTPTITNVLNVSSSSIPYTCYYSKVGNIVTVSGIIDITPTASGAATSLYLSLPISIGTPSTSKFISGVATSTNNGAVLGMFGQSYLNAHITYVSTSTFLNEFNFTFTYEVQ
jgi:hypothetical protein